MWGFVHRLSYGPFDTLEINNMGGVFIGAPIIICGYFSNSLFKFLGFNLLCNHKILDDWSESYGVGVFMQVRDTH